jgi:hypothetical protein
MGRADAKSPPALRVAVACSPRAGVALELEVEIASPATVADALRASGLLERYPELSVGAGNVGIWGRACSIETALADGDRVELYRPLTMDPNEARRLRARRLREAARR